MIMKSYCEHYSDSPPECHNGRTQSLSHLKYHKLWKNHGSELLFKLTKFSSEAQSCSCHVVVWNRIAVLVYLLLFVLHINYLALLFL